MNEGRPSTDSDAKLTRDRSLDVLGWQPIETAPKDGTQILLWERQSRGPFMGWWHDGWPSLESYWTDEAETEPDPTHWMELPERPVLP